MEEIIRRDLANGHAIDITTTGRMTGLPRRIEIVFHNIDGRIFISGMPRADRTRAWLHNLAADPRFTFHLKGTVKADLPASARIIVDPLERRSILERIAPVWRQNVEAMVAHSPLIEVELEGHAPDRAA